MRTTLRKTFWSIAILLTTFAAPASADSALFAASSYNVFIQNNFTLPSGDSEGRVAAGGVLTVGTAGGTSLATALPANDTSFDVVGGTDFIADKSGSSNGNLYDGTAGGIASNFTVNGAVTNGPGHDPIDFSTAFSQLTSLSNALAAKAPTGSGGCTTNGYGTLTCNAGASGLNVIDVPYGTTATKTAGGAVNSYDLAHNVGINFNIAPGATLVINVLGASPQGLNFSGASWNVNGDSTKLLVNFNQATSLTLGSAAFYTSLLAPDAAVTLGGGNFNGNFIASSMTNGNTEFHNALFSGDLSSVSAAPEPSSWLLLGGGFLLIAAKKKR
jgi:choice-of-anchor A domain-containing protein